MNETYKVWAHATLRWLTPAQQEAMTLALEETEVTALSVWESLWEVLLQEENLGSVCASHEGVQGHWYTQNPQLHSQALWAAAQAVWKRVGFLGDDSSTESLVVDDGQRYYMRAHFADEVNLASRIKALSSLGQGSSTGLTEADCLAMEEAFFKPKDRQKDAIHTALLKRFSVVTGGPGTGKTTTVVHMLRALLNSPEEGGSIKRVGLAAPTGKATVRVKESVTQNLKEIAYFEALRQLDAQGGLMAKTLHRWLHTLTSNNAKPSPQNPLELDVLIIDEASMIDCRLAKQVFDVIDPKRTRVVLLGDKYQLAAVNPGSVFADITEALSEQTTELNESSRFKPNSLIDKLAQAVKEGHVEEAKRNLNQHDEHYRVTWHSDLEAGSLASQEPLIVDQDKRVPPVAQRELEGHLKAYIEALKVYFNQADALDKDAKQKQRQTLFEHLNAFKVLCAERRGLYSVNALNEWSSAYVKKALKPFLRAQGISDAQMDKLFMDEMAWPGLPIIVRQNDHELDVCNGDLAVVLPEDVRAPEWRLKAFFEMLGASKEEKSINTILLPRYDQAFAITIHQSQGSEYKDVYIFLPSSKESHLATRELLYTGITRTKGEVYLYGHEDVLCQAIKTKTERTSGLQERLKA